MLVNAGFELEAVYGDMSFDEPKADEQRLVINRFDRKTFTELGFYADLDEVIDAVQTQLIALVPRYTFFS